MNARLLVADDHATHRLVGLTFAAEPVEVVAVSDGEEARQRLRLEGADVVLAATSLPRLDGYALAEFVRREPALVGVRVLLLASPFDEVDKERLHQSGAAGVLVKPLEPEAMVAWVRDLIARSSRRAAAGWRAEDEDPAPARAIAPAAAGDTAALLAEPPAVPQPPATLDLDELSEALAAFDAQGTARAGQDPTGGVPVSAGPQTSGYDVADAFDALLTAEQSGDLLPAASANLSDADVERITARVLERLDERLSPGMVREIVTEIAERLVREEIERIRARAELHNR